MKPFGTFKPLVWLKRFRHRCGYGVHSPFAFDFITQVVYQKTPYYKYKELAAEEKRLSAQKDKQWLYEPQKVKRLLFRLVNFAQPDTIVDAGTLSASSLYLQAAKVGAKYVEAPLNPTVGTDFMSVRDYSDISDIDKLCPYKSVRDYSDISDIDKLCPYKSVRDCSDISDIDKLCPYCRDRLYVCPFGGVGGAVFLYLHAWRTPQFVEEVLQTFVPRATKRSLFVVEGIRYTRQMHDLWKRAVQDERAGITFDLYDLGILFFDRSKPKQDYIVNF